MISRRLLGVAGLAALGCAALAWGLDRPQAYGANVDFRVVIGPPPAPGSAAATAERAGFARTIAGIDSPAWQAAKAQVFPSSPEVMQQLGCAIGRAISPVATPVTARLLGRVAADVRMPSEAAKAFYKRDRPFVGASDSRTCDPRTLGSIGGTSGGVLSYSYPSGHAATGAIWARTLADVVPARAATISAWGRALGDNRVTCRVHWPSDIVAGRQLGDAVYARLTTLPAFRADIAAARAELARATAATGC
ncbi:MAG: phosphatase PAP2 family protein [Polymorphobacter sp.]